MVLTAASTDRLLGTWGTTPSDPNDHFAQGGDIISTRGEWLDDNDAIARAIVDTIVGGTLGSTGLQYRSAFQHDDRDDITPEEIAVRKSVEAGILRGTRGTSFDAGGVLSRREMSKVTLISTITTGISFSFRCFLPNRPGRHSHAVCWRLPHSSRISNPNHGANTDRVRDGFELDANGTPTAVFVQRSHPASTQTAPKQKWDHFPLYDADGYQAVTHHALHRRADQLRPTGWFTPVIQLLRLFGRTLEAKTVADTLKASMGLIVECDDPEAAAAMDRNGAVLTGTTKIMPGKCYYVAKGTKWSTLNFNYNGADFDKWQEVILTNVCAAFGVPYEFVQMKLTRSNMAAARVALLQAYRTFHGYQSDLITSTEDPWNQSLIREDLARGRIAGVDITNPDQVERLLIGRYLRPPRFMPDPLKEQQAADVATKRNGISYDTAFAEMGLDVHDEWAMRQQNDAELKRRGIVLQGDGSVMAPGPGQTPPQPDDDEEIPPDEPARTAPADEPSPNDTPTAGSMSSAELTSTISDAIALAREAINRPLPDAPPITINLTTPPRGPLTIARDPQGRMTGVTEG